MIEEQGHRNRERSCGSDLRRPLATAEPPPGPLPDPPTAGGSTIPLRFDLREASGGLGDLGTFLPLAMAVAVIGAGDLATIFLFAGLCNIATGWLLRQPLPVQPMKAIAAVAIVGGLDHGGMLAAGMIAGGIVLVLGLTGIAGRVARLVPPSVVAGIQLGIGISLGISAVVMVLEDVRSDGGWQVALALAALAALVVGHARRVPIAVVVVLAGVGVIALRGLPDLGAWAPLDLRLQWPAAGSWWDGLVAGALPQLPLTLLNSVVAVCALSARYYPGRGIAPDRMATSVGLMNVCTVPFGGLPVCHGAGGLAAQYRCGARTGGSVIMLGIFKIALALGCGAWLATIVDAYPIGILAALLVVAGWELARAARWATAPRSLTVVLACAGGLIAWNTLVGVACGLLVWLILRPDDRAALPRSAAD
jgi:MFS superfamily sulfate permease-like transporter